MFMMSNSPLCQILYNYIKKFNLVIKFIFCFKREWVKSWSEMSWQLLWSDTYTKGLIELSAVHHGTLTYYTLCICNHYISIVNRSTMLQEYRSGKFTYPLCMFYWLSHSSSSHKSVSKQLVALTHRLLAYWL